MNEFCLNVSDRASEEQVVLTGVFHFFGKTKWEIHFQHAERRWFSHDSWKILQPRSYYR